MRSKSSRTACPRAAIRRVASPGSKPAPVNVDRASVTGSRSAPCARSVRARSGLISAVGSSVSS
ncbi:Uncharacterised protein [Mycobacteroides abscessus]|nr:Uncharacterised protein [Mycobacteroides abscessus]